MVIGREDALRITEAIFMLTSEFNRVFSLNSLRVLTGDYYGDAVNWLIENGLATRVNDRYLRVTVPRLRLLAVAGGELVVRHVDDLSWSEFEEFISFTLNQAGYQTLRGVRLTVGGVRGEFDVIGYRGDVFMNPQARSGRSWVPWNIIPLYSLTRQGASALNLDSTTTFSILVWGYWPLSSFS